MPRLPESMRRDPASLEASPLTTYNHLVVCLSHDRGQRQEDRADAWFHALADRTRRDILRRVLAGEHSVSALAQSYDMSFAAVQKHVAVLERAGLLTKRRQGREALASGDVEAVRSVGVMLTELEALWRGRISRMDELFATDP